MTKSDSLSAKERVPPCPFCGSEKIQTGCYIRDGGKVQCSICFAATIAYNPNGAAKALEKWNGRLPASPEPELVTSETEKAAQSSDISHPPEPPYDPCDICGQTLAFPANGDPRYAGDTMVRSSCTHVITEYPHKPTQMMKVAEPVPHRPVSRPPVSPESENWVKCRDCRTTWDTARWGSTNCPVCAEPLLVEKSRTPEDEINTLVDQFARALKEKLVESEIKYGWQNGWMKDDWKADLLNDIRKHVEKGDPRDVAAYCAFAWHHGWSLVAEKSVAEPAEEK